MFHIINTRVLALVALLAVGGGLQADIIIRAGPVTVRVGQGVSVNVRPVVNVEVRPLMVPRGTPAMPPAAPTSLPVLPPDGVPLQIAPPAPPVPLPGADTTRSVSEKPQTTTQGTQTIYDFATSFKPSAGTHEAVVMHPYSNTPVKISFTLPDGTPSVKIKGGLRRAVEFNYGNRVVEVWFYRNGQVVVRN
jgi:hypothetical protein